jgi:hypothetical protein
MTKSTLQTYRYVLPTHLVRFYVPRESRYHVLVRELASALLSLLPSCNRPFCVHISICGSVI